MQRDDSVPEVLDRDRPVRPGEHQPHPHDLMVKPDQPPNPHNGLGGLFGGLLGGGAAGGILSGGLGDLLKQFQQNGHGDKAQSWIASGPNKSVSPSELERALGPEKITWLMDQTGLSREELLAGLSRELPKAVDQLTPDGRLPTEQEAARLI